MGRVESSFKEYIRKGMDTSVALAMAHRDETDRIALASRPPIEIPTYKYVEPYVSDEDRGPDPDETPKFDLEVELGIVKDATIEVPTAHVGAGPVDIDEPVGFTHESLPGKSYKTAPALKAALTALAKREANGN